MAEIGESYLATGLLDAALSCDEQLFGALQTALIIVIIEGMSVHLLE